MPTGTRWRAFAARWPVPPRCLSRRRPRGGWRDGRALPEGSNRQLTATRGSLGRSQTEGSCSRRTDGKNCNELERNPLLPSSYYYAVRGIDHDLLRFVYTTTKMRHFRVRLAGFMNLHFFIIDKMANTNTKTLHFHRNVNQPLAARYFYSL